MMQLFQAEAKWLNDLQLNQITNIDLCLDHISQTRLLCSVVVVHGYSLWWIYTLFIANLSPWLKSRKWKDRYINMTQINHYSNSTYYVKL